MTPGLVDYAWKKQLVRPPPDFKMMFAGLRGRSFQQSELLEAFEKVYLDTIGVKSMPDGIDPIHIIDLAIELGWIDIDFDTGLYSVL